MAGAGLSASNRNSGVGKTDMEDMIAGESSKILSLQAWHPLSALLLLRLTGSLAIELSWVPGKF